MDDSARIRVYLNDPAGRGDSLVSRDPPAATDDGPWGFRVEGKVPEPRAYAPDTPEFLHWQLAAALDRGKRLWTARLPGAGAWIPGPVLPAVPVAGRDLNAFYDRKALRFFRDVDEKTGAVVQSGESPDIATHEQGHAVLDAIRPDLWDAPHFEVAAFHEAFGDLAAIFVALAEPAVAEAAIAATEDEPSRSNLVSRLAEELGGAVRHLYGPEGALPGSLRDAVNPFAYEDPRGLPDSAPARALSAEPHSFCRVMSGACWDALVAAYRAASEDDRAVALALAAETIARLGVAAAETAPSGADFFGRFARRVVREAVLAGETSLADAIAQAFFRRRLLVGAQVPPDLLPDEDPDVTPPAEGEPPSPALVRAIDARLGTEGGGELLLLGSRRAASAAPAEGSGPRVLRGRRTRDLPLRGEEYGPADGASVTISDAFSLGFGESGFLVASRMRPASDRDATDARAFVRHLVRTGRIAGEASTPDDPVRLARERKSHQVVLEPDGVRRLRRAWIAGDAAR